MSNSSSAQETVLAPMLERLIQLRRWLSRRSVGSAAASGSAEAIDSCDELAGLVLPCTATRLAFGSEGSDELGRGWSSAAASLCRLNSSSNRAERWDRRRMGSAGGEDIA